MFLRNHKVTNLSSMKKRAVFLPVWMSINHFRSRMAYTRQLSWQFVTAMPERIMIKGSHPISSDVPQEQVVGVSSQFSSAPQITLIIVSIVIERV